MSKLVDGWKKLSEMEPPQFFNQLHNIERDGFDFWDNLLEKYTIIRIIYKTALWVPPLLIFVLFCYSNFLYSYLFCIHTLLQMKGLFFLSAFFLVTFNLIWFMACWSLFKSIYSDPGVVPTEFHEVIKYKSEMLRNSRSNESISENTINEIQNNYPTCRKCKLPKPPRAHHCRHCKKCIRKMDHHCPVINNCVGWGNYKYFVLLLSWAAVMCLYGGLTGATKFYYVGFLGMNFTEIQMVVGLIIATVYGIMLVPFAGIHYSMIFQNKTTLEGVIPISAYANTDIFNIGWKANFEQVFGKDKTLWFVPVFTSQGDGCSFPTRQANPSSARHLEQIV